MVKTVKERTEEMLSVYSALGEDISDGSLFQILASMFAFETLQTEEDINKALLNAYPSAADEESLELNGYNMGVDRLEETFATGQITIIAEEGTVINAGLKAIRKSDDFKYTIQDTVTVGLVPVVVNIIADVKGKIGNTYVGGIDSLSDMEGIQDVSNDNEISNGTDKEEIETYRDRIVSFTRRPKRSGNSAHYVEWAEEVEGIERAKCFPAWDGGGTVKVTAISDTFEPITAEKRIEMENYILKNVPIDAVLTTTVPTKLDLNLEIEVVYTDGWSNTTAEEDIKVNLNNFLQENIIFLTDSNNSPLKISYLDISSVIFNSESVKSVTSLKINGATLDVVPADEEVPTVGTITLT